MFKFSTNMVISDWAKQIGSTIVYSIQFRLLKIHKKWNQLELSTYKTRYTWIATTLKKNI